VNHLFVSPHPDDAALSCGGLILRLTGRGERVEIVTIFSGAGRRPALTPYQRLALGFGSQDPWAPGTATADSEAAEPSGEDGAPSPREVMERRRTEDRDYARFVGASVVHLDMPDAVFRDYVGDEELLGEPKPGDLVPVRELRAVIEDRSPDRVYAPLAVGGHTDHRLARRAAVALVGAAIAPESLRFYEDFPYAHNLGFGDPGTLDAEFAAGLPVGWSLVAEAVPISDVLSHKARALQAYASQLGRLFGGEAPMARAVRERAEAVGRQAGIEPSERYWRLVRT
jgi:LmbE family N-acetylglucosaminyl deacetylase